MGNIKWFLSGGLIGAGAALAFAPKTGEETRAFVAEKANAFAGEAKDFGAGLPGSATDAINAAREQGVSMLKDATGKTTGLASDASAKVKGANDAEADELRAKIEAARQRIAAQVMENAEQAKEAAEDVSEAVVEEAESVAEEVAEKADEAKHAAK